MQLLRFTWFLWPLSPILSFRLDGGQNSISNMEAKLLVIFKGVHSNGVRNETNNQLQEVDYKIYSSCGVAPLNKCHLPWRTRCVFAKAFTLFTGWWNVAISTGCSLEGIESLSSRTSWRSCQGFGRNGKGAPEKVLPKLQQALKDSNATLRSGAARALGAMGGAATPALPQLGEALQDSNETVRATAGEALWRMYDELPSTDKSEIHRMQKEMVPLMPQLRQALQDSVVEVRSFAAHTLTFLGKAAAPAVPQLQEALRDSIAQVRIAAVHALEALGGEAAEAAPQLVEALKDDAWIVKYGASEALKAVAKEAPKKVLPQLLEALQDSSWKIRLVAAEALKAAGKEAVAAVPQLQMALKDSDKDVRSAAQAALESIEGSSQAAGSSHWFVSEHEKRNDTELGLSCETKRTCLAPTKEVERK